MKVRGSSARLLVAAVVTFGALAAELEQPLVAYVHVGRGKVASTSIQEYLCSSHKDLVEKHNLQLLVPSKCLDSLYCGEYGRGTAQAICSHANGDPIPNDKVESSWGGHGQRCRLEGSAGAVPETRKLAAEAAEAGRNVVLSSEYFFGMESEQVAYLEDVLQGFEVRVLVMVRHPARYMLSIWAQKWRQKRAHGWLSRDMAIWYHQQSRPQGKMVQVTDSFVNATRNFVNALGPRRVFVGSLEGFIRDGLTAGQGFLQEFCGVDSSDVQLEGRIHQSLNLAKKAGQSNLSLSAFALEMLHFMRLFSEEEGGTKVPRWPLPRQLPHVEKGVRMLGDILGDELWSCKDYADDFSHTTRHFGEAMRAIEGVTLLKFDVDVDKMDSAYYHPGSMVICHGDAEGLRANKEKHSAFVKEMGAFLSRWKSEEWED